MVIYWLSVLRLCAGNVSGLSHEGKEKMKKYLTLIIVTILVWTGIFAIALVIIQSAEAEPKNLEMLCSYKKADECKAEAPCCLENLRTYNSGNSAYGELKREEAIKFGLEKIDTTINYLFVGVAGIFALLVKLVIEPITYGQKIEHLSKWILWWIVNCAALGASSIGCGFFARLQWNSIGNIRAFSIYGELGTQINLQLFLFALAFIFLVVTIIVITYKKKKESVR